MNLLQQVSRDLASAIEPIANRKDNVKFEVHWVPHVDRKELIGKLLILSPDARRSVMLSRGAKRNELDFILGIIKPLEAFGGREELADRYGDAKFGWGFDDEAVEFGQGLVDDLVEGILGKRIGNSKAYCARIDQPIATIPDHWRDLRQFSTLLKFEMEV